MAFSTSAALDALIHLAAFLLECGLAYLLLLLASRHRFEKNFFRTVIVVAGLAVARLYLAKADWAAAPLAELGALCGMAMLLSLALLRTGPAGTLVAAVALAALSIGMPRLASRCSAMVLPEGPRFAEYLGLAESALERSKARQGSAAAPSVDLRGVARRGLDALASLTDRQERESMRGDFAHGVELFAERKAWMDSLSPQEKRAYREEMAAFLAEQGLAEDRYSLAAIRQVDPTNLVALASLFEGLRQDETEREEPMRSIPESLATIAANLGGFTLGEEEMASLRRFTELFAEDEVKAAMDQARAELEATGGEDRVAGMVLAAIIQAQSGLPADQFLGADGGALFDPDAVRALAAKYRAYPGRAAETSAMVGEEVEAAVPDRPDPFIQVSSPLGVAYIPADDPDMAGWVSAVGQLEIKGYAVLGREIAILRNNGTVCIQGEELAVDHAGSRYRFQAESILRGRVVLRAVGREAAAP